MLKHEYCVKQPYQMLLKGQKSFRIFNNLFVYLLKCLYTKYFVVPETYIEHQNTTWTFPIFFTPYAHMIIIHHASLMFTAKPKQ